MVAHNVSGSEPGVGGDRLEAQLGLFEQLLGADDALPVVPRRRVVPMSARKRRAKVRGDMRALRASCSIGRSSPRFCSIHSATSAKDSAQSLLSGAWMYCAWPPSRWGGTTIRRATTLATHAPSSMRTMCGAASMPAAVPALETTPRSSTYSTSGSAVMRGYSVASWSACMKWVAARRGAATVEDAGLSKREGAAVDPQDWGPRASAVISRPAPMIMSKPRLVRIGPGAAVAMVKPKEGPPVSSGSMPKTSQIALNSNGETPGKERSTFFEHRDCQWQE